MARRPQSASHLAERIAALEAAWAGLPDKIAAAMADAAERLTPAVAHEALSAQVAALSAQVAAHEAKIAYSAGAVKVEERVRDKAHEWARTLTPLAWPVCLALAAFALSGRMPLG